jgi:hypothetical protein
MRAFIVCAYHSSAFDAHFAVLLGALFRFSLFLSVVDLMTLLLMSFVSKATNLGGGEHHTNRTMGETRSRESWPMHWLEDSKGQKKDCRFPMVGK